MNKIVKVAEGIDEEQLSKAEELHKEVLARTYITANNLLELGKLFKTIRDEKLYKLLGAETFTEYCGFPEISFGRSTIYSFIHTYELYVLRLGISSERLSKIGHRKLQIISPIAKDMPHGIATATWIANAEVLSESDLINEVRRAQNKPEMIPKPKEEENVYPFSQRDYREFVSTHPCVVCGRHNAECHHFPKTKGAGAREQDVMPLCRECHMEYHHDAYDFVWLNKDKIFRYFYDNILKAFEIIRRNG